MSVHPDVDIHMASEALKMQIPHVVHGRFMANEKYAFSAKRADKGLRVGSTRGAIDIQLNDPILSKPYTYFFDRLGIPYQKKGLRQAGVERSNGACYSICEPDTQGLWQIAFSGVVDKFEKARLRPTVSTFVLSFDDRSSATPVLEVIKKGALATVLYPFLHTFFTVTSANGVQSLFDTERAAIGLDNREFDSFNIPMRSLVVGERHQRSGNLSITFDSREAKVFEPQIIPES